MRYRKLRIAWSVGSGLAAVLLIALWVRSYWSVDWIAHRSKELIYEGIQSESGAIYYTWMDDTGDTQGFVPWNHHSWPAGPGVSPTFDYIFDPGFHIDLCLPYRYPVAITAILTAIPWLWYFKRFSLRTLFIATTLVAVVLGLIVWAARK